MEEGNLRLAVSKAVGFELCNLADDVYTDATKLNVTIDVDRIIRVHPPISTSIRLSSRPELDATAVARAVCHHELYEVGWDPRHTIQRQKTGKGRLLPSLEADLFLTHYPQALEQLKEIDTSLGNYTREEIKKSELNAIIKLKKRDFLKSVEVCSRSLLLPP